MKIRTEQTVLLAALNAAGGIVDKKSILSVLAQVCIETVGKDAIRVSATDYDVSLLAVYPAEVIEAGKACVACRGAIAAVKTLADGPLTLATMPNDWVEIVAGHAQLHLLGIPPADFPDLADPDEAAAVTLARTDLARLLSHCAPCMSADETRMNICGVLFEANQGDEPGTVRAKATATDGHRLAHVSQAVTVPDPLAAPLRAILHRKGVAEIQRMLAGGEDETIGVGTHAGSLVFRYGNAVLLVRAIEDDYPEYAKIIPVDPPTRVCVGTEDVTAALRIAASVTTAKVSLVKLTVEDGRLTIFGANPDSGDATAKCDADVKGPGATIGLCAKYLSEALDACGGTDLRLGLSDDASPVLVTPFEDDGSLTVVMPMRI